MLTIVPTPIGNLQDISERAKQALQACDFVIAENPLYSGKLLQNLSITKKPFVQLADFNEHKIIESVILRLQNQNACLISDAGTPAISDPGFKIVRACRESKIQVTALPGPNAALTALSASGLPTDKFLFVGFLPKTEYKILVQIDQAKNIEATLIAYESPQRINKTIQIIAKHFSGAKIVIARELTKLHEEYLIGSAQEVLDILKTRQNIKGEITLLISFK